jgi:hypothetical protein
MCFLWGTNTFRIFRLIQIVPKPRLCWRAPAAISGVGRVPSVWDVSRDPETRMTVLARATRNLPEPNRQEAWGHKKKQINMGKTEEGGKRKYK